eukprot:sb/3472290/
MPYHIHPKIPCGDVQSSMIIWPGNLKIFGYKKVTFLSLPTSTIRPCSFESVSFARYQAPVPSDSYFFNHNDSQDQMCDVSPPNQVKNLPDFICQPTRVSDRVSNIYSKQSDHHEQALIEYQSKIKNVNSKIESRIQYRCQAAARKLADVYGFIQDNHISALRKEILLC